MHTRHDRSAVNANTHPLERNRLSVLLAALLAAAVLLPLLGHRPLTDWDEGIYAEIAREMLATHTLAGWLVPHWNGHLWFEKPPLQMWLTAASLRLFGLNAFAARLPSALAGIASVTVLHAWLQRRCSALAAWLSTVVLLSAFGFQHAARAGETDTLLTLFCLLAVLGLAELLQDNAAGWLLFWTGFGLALMTKGAGSLTLPLTALTALHPRHLLRHVRAFTFGLLLFLALTVPWHAFVYAHFGQAFLHDYLGFHTLTRATTAIEGHHTHPWFYLWVLLVSAPLSSVFYPWALAAPFRRAQTPLIARNSKAHGSATTRRNGATTSGTTPPSLAPQSLASQTSSATNLAVSTPTQNSPTQDSQLNRTPPTPSAEAFLSAKASASLPEDPRPTPLQALALHALLTLLLFSGAGTRLPHYIAPAYPALSALTAALVAQWLQARPLRTPQWTAGLALAALLLYVGSALATARARKALHNPELRNGYTTPDNRESVALLQQLQRTATPLPDGPLLVWRQTPVVPVTTDAFYARRLAEQVSLTPPPADLPPDPYFNDPKPLSQAVPVPRLILLETGLVPQLPPNLQLLRIAVGPSQTLAIVQPATTTGHRG